MKKHSSPQSIGNGSAALPSAQSLNFGKKTSWMRILTQAAIGMAMSMPKIPKRAPPASEAKRMVGVSMPVLLPWIFGVRT